MKRLQRLQGFIIGFIVSCILLSSVSAFAESINALFNVVNIKINGTQVAKIGDSYTLSNGEEVPFSILYKGTTYLPMRKLAELLGKEVTWDGETKTAIVNDKTTPTPAPTPTPTPSEATQIGDQWVVSIDKEDLPFTLNAKNGMSLTINKVTASTGGIRINLTLKNNSTVSDKGRPMTSTWEIFDGKETLKHLNQDDIFYDYIRSGQSITGNVNFAGLSHDTDSIILYGGLWQYIDREEFKIIIKLK